MKNNFVSVGKEGESLVSSSLPISSLFFANCTTENGEVKHRTIHLTPGTSITYSGPGLGPDDIDVLIALSHLSRDASSSKNTFCLKTNFAEMLKELVWPIQTSSCDRLEASLQRLSRAHIVLKEVGGPTGRRVVRSMFGNLLGVTATVKTNVARRSSISTLISPSMLELCEQISGVPWTQRKLIKHSTRTCSDAK